MSYICDVGVGNLVFKRWECLVVMDIHICNSVEFEKVKVWKDAIPLTRKRMSIQQLLDSGEDNDMLKNQLEIYVKDFDKVLQLIVLERHQPLENHPNFSWSIGSEHVSSPCWKFEAVLARLALANIYIEEGSHILENMIKGDEEKKISGDEEKDNTEESYKSSSRLYMKAIELHQQIINHLENWKWKLPEMNQYFFQQQWNQATISHLQTLRHLNMISVGIDKNLSSKSLEKLAQRSVQSAAMTIVHWPDAWPNILPLCEYMRYYFSANSLWSQEKYGASIQRMKMWLVNNKPEVSHYRFKSIEEEMEKVDFLFKERERINNGAYFDVIEEDSNLKTTVHLIQNM
jgi:hypothetical protein